jgi:hypothetical protein
LTVGDRPDAPVVVAVNSRLGTVLLTAGCADRALAYSLDVPHLSLGVTVRHTAPPRLQRNAAEACWDQGIAARES